MILSDRQDSHLLPIVYETTALLMSYEVAPASLLGKMEPAAGVAPACNRLTRSACRFLHLTGKWSVGQELHLQRA